MKIDLSHRNTDCSGAFLFIKIMKEIFKAVKGYEEYYKISTFGRVKSFKRKRAVFLKPVKDNKGYGHICLLKKGKTKNVRVHRLVAMTFLSNPLNKPQVNHKDGDKSNNKLTNLEWANNSDNQLHAYKIGLQPSRKGELNGNSKINLKIANQIRDLYKNKIYNQYEIASLYNITQGCVTQVITNKVWQSTVLH